MTLVPHAHVWMSAANSNRGSLLLLGPMETERISPRYSGIDVWDPADVLDAMIEGQFAAVAAVRARPRARAGGTCDGDPSRATRPLDLLGCWYLGPSGRPGRRRADADIQLAAERLLLLIAGGNTAMVRAVEGAEDEIEQAVVLVNHHGVGSTDVLTPLRQAARHRLHWHVCASRSGSAR